MRAFGDDAHCRAAAHVIAANHDPGAHQIDGRRLRAGDLILLDEGAELPATTPAWSVSNRLSCTLIGPGAEIRLAAHRPDAGVFSPENRLEATVVPGLEPAKRTPMRSLRKRLPLEEQIVRILGHIDADVACLESCILDAEATARTRIAALAQLAMASPSSETLAAATSRTGPPPLKHRVDLASPLAGHDTDAVRVDDRG